MNLSLFKPKKDQCDVCVQYEEGNMDKEAYDRHIKLKDMAHRQKDIRQGNVRRRRINCGINNGSGSSTVGSSTQGQHTVLQNYTSFP